MMKTSFKDRVLKIVSNIPEGSTLTYKQVAKLAGNEKAARAVGVIMSKNYDPNVPCHRVIGSNGSMGGYNRGGQRKKYSILREEGFLMKR